MEFKVKLDDQRYFTKYKETSSHTAEKNAHEVFPFLHIVLYMQVGSKYKGCKGSRGKPKIMEGECCMVICKEDLVSVKEMEEKVDQLEKENVSLQNTVEEWKEKYSYLEEAQEQLFNEVKEHYEKKAESTASLHRQAQEFLTFANKGKPHNEVGLRQQQRQRATMKNRAEKALWFANSFGFRVRSLHLSDVATDDGIVLQFDEPTNNTVSAPGLDAGSASVASEDDDAQSADTSAAAQSASVATEDDIDTPASIKRKRMEQRYTDLPQEEKDVIMKIVYLLDRFSGSDALYHELTQLYDDMPRSYMVWCYRRLLDSTFEVKQLDGPYEGAYMPLTPLLQGHICRMLAKKGKDSLPTEGFHITISGDGAEFSRSSSYVLKHMFCWTTMT